MQLFVTCALLVAFAYHTEALSCYQCSYNSSGDPRGTFPVINTIGFNVACADDSLNEGALTKYTYTAGPTVTLASSVLRICEYCSKTKRVYRSGVSQYDRGCETRVGIVSSGYTMKANKCFNTKNSANPEEVDETCICDEDNCNSAVMTSVSLFSLLLSPLLARFF